MSDKLITFTMFSRNDNYVPNNLYIISTTLNYLSRNLASSGHLDNSEIIITDWGSEVPLSMALHLSDESKNICRFLYLNKNITNQVEESPNRIQFGKAVNVGVRRANGKYTYFTNSDTLIPKAAVNVIFGIINNECGIKSESAYFSFARYQVPWQFVARTPIIKEIDRYILQSSGRTLDESARMLSLSKGVGSMLVNSKIIKTARGVREDLPAWGGHEVELGLRITQRHPWYELSRPGGAVYHMVDPPTSYRRQIIKDQKYKLLDSFAANDSTWGLGEYPIEEQRCTNNTFKSVTIAVKSNDPLIDAGVLAKYSRVIFNTFDKILKSNVVLSNNDIIINHLVAWYIENYSPSIFVNVGAEKGQNSYLVSYLYPAMEMYLIDNWQRDNNVPLYIARNIELTLKHQGYLRFVSGDLQSSYDRMANSFLGDLNADLVIINVKSKVEYNKELIDSYLGTLNSNGLLIISRESGSEFSPVTEYLSALEQDYTVKIIGGFNIGFVFKKTVPDTNNELLLGRYFMVKYKINYIVYKIIYLLRSIYSKCRICRMAFRDCIIFS